MIRYLKLLVVLMATFFTTSALAFIPPPAPATGSIVDQVGVLTPSEMRSLNMQLRQVNQSTTNQIGILIIPSLNGENIRDIGYTTAKAWKVGQAGVDNGVMIVWARGDKQVGIETGKGVEADLPDLKCNDIIANVIRPRFKNRQFADGLSAAITAINTSIGDHRAALQAQRDKENALQQNAPTPDQSSPQTTAPSSGGCDVSGVAMQSTGLGVVLFWALLLSMGVWGVRRWARKAAEQSRQEEARQQELRQRRLEIDRKDAQQSRQEEARQRQLLEKVEHDPIPIVPVGSPFDFHYDPISSDVQVATYDPIAEKLKRVRQEEMRQARLKKEQEDRETVVVSSDDDDSNDDDSSSCSSSDGGGEFGGGGSDGSACSS